MSAPEEEEPDEISVISVNALGYFSLAGCCAVGRVGRSPSPVECMERDELADFRRENRQRRGAKIPADFGGNLEMSDLFFLISLTNYRKAVILQTFPILYSDQSIV